MKAQWDSTSCTAFHVAKNPILSFAVVRVNCIFSAAPASEQRKGLIVLQHIISFVFYLMH